MGGESRLSVCLYVLYMLHNICTIYKVASALKVFFLSLLVSSSSDWSTPMRLCRTEECWSDLLHELGVTTALHGANNQRCKPSLLATVCTNSFVYRSYLVLNKLKKTGKSKLTHDLFVQDALNHVRLRNN